MKLFVEEKKSNQLSGRREESGRKAEGSDTDREKKFNLVRCSTETLDLQSQSLREGEGGQRRVRRSGAEATNLPQMISESL